MVDASAGCRCFSEILKLTFDDVKGTCDFGWKPFDRLTFDWLTFDWLTFG